MAIMSEKIGYISREDRSQNGILELKNKLSKMKKKIIKYLNRVLDIAGERISKPEDRSIKIIQSEKQKENTLEKKKMNWATETCGLLKKIYNIQAIGVSQEKKGVKLRKN